MFKINLGIYICYFIVPLMEQREFLSSMVMEQENLIWCLQSNYWCFSFRRDYRPVTEYYTSIVCQTELPFDFQKFFCRQRCACNKLWLIMRIPGTWVYVLCSSYSLVAKTHTCMLRHLCVFNWCTCYMIDWIKVQSHIHEHTLCHSWVDDVAT